MSNEKKVIQTDEKIDAQREAEKMEILARVNETKGMQQIIDDSGSLTTRNELRAFAIGDVDDPDRKHEVYYKGIEKLLREFLGGRKDKQTKEAFKILREEKNIFLNRGKRKNEQGIRGSDARMAYITDMEEALNIIAGCILDAATPVDLYIAFRDKNVERGFYNDLSGARKATSMDGDEHLKDVIGAMNKKP
jgi:hypothetical protein